MCQVENAREILGRFAPFPLNCKRGYHWSSKTDVYKRQIEYSGPLFRVAAPEGAAMRVYFTHADGIEARGGGAITGFEVAGADGKYFEAQARVEGGTVVVSTPQVPAPVAVRYAWADNPACNLVNGTNLPAGPFRSDEPHYNR